MLQILVDIVGVLGFLLSLMLAISKLVSNRLRISAGDMVLIDANQKAKNSLFILVTLTNKISIPFTVTGVSIRNKTNHVETQIEKTVRTYTRRANDAKLAVKPVVLSQEFPARFEPYDAKVFLFELSRQRIDSKLLLRDVPVHSPAGLPLLRRFQHKLYIHQLPFRLVLNTSRGRRAIPIVVSEVRDWDFLESFAVQKAAYEEKILFPE